MLYNAPSEIYVHIGDHIASNMFQWSKSSFKPLVFAQKIYFEKEIHW